ncbi:pentatricopeptide repeat-containing protein At1g08070, chloroplastic-like [Cryptomeria japonica]|uniref:pentatricopeptide repeat-containing protein At1g08070, chloroplastic-like n=1 Tax=Cryptomeria japonica TaxID=3369 RepID=UPI0027DA17D7|nr:pentatricopeptide repeat-containing protein At1g08070, chloroplastic-like [Cryptomeria japonica]
MGFFDEALQIFKQMQLLDVKQNSTTSAIILPACTQIGEFELGTVIHQSIIKSGFISDIIVGNTLIDMHAKRGGYAQYGFVQTASETFKQMQLEGVKPNSTTFSSLLPICAKRGALEQGMNVHQSIIKRGFWLDVVVANSLIDMYAKCGSIRKSCELFDKMLQIDAISWTAMIAGYAHNGFVEKALETFKQMQLTDVKPDSTTFVIIVPACTNVRALEQGYAQNGFVEKALETFKQMLLADVKLDSTTFASILPAFAKMGALEQFTELHQSIIKSGILFDAKKYARNRIVEKALETFKQMLLADRKPKSTNFVSTVSASTNIGDLKKNVETYTGDEDSFDRIPQRNVISLSSTVEGYVQNGFCNDTL